MIAPRPDEPQVQDAETRSALARPTWARWVTRISLAVALVALGFTIRNTGVGTIVRYFHRIGWWWFAVLALEVAITSLDAVAIRAFLSPEQALVKLRSALLSQLAGRSVNVVTPMGNLGEAVKVSVLTEHVSQSRAVATILLYNVVSFCVELGMVAAAAPMAAWLVPMPPALRTVMFVTGGVCFVLTVGLYTLVHYGVLSSIARLARSLRIVSERKFRQWHDSLMAVDDKMRLQAGARRRDRWLGIVAVVLSRGTSMTLSLLILHAVGEPITLGFVAAYTVGGFVIYMLSSLVPMGLGISEGGNWELFRALGENPARGVTLVVARRVTLVIYAALGLVLLAASETVQRARSPRVVGLPTARVVVASNAAPELIDASD